MHHVHVAPTFKYFMHHVHVEHHQLLIRQSKAIYPVVNQITFELEFCQVKSLPIWASLLEKHKDQKEIINEFRLGVLAFATLVIEGDDASKFKACPVPQYNKWVVLNPNLETSFILQPATDLMLFLQGEISFCGNIASLVMSYLEVPLGKRLMYIFEIGGAKDITSSCRWSSLFHDEFAAAPNPGRCIREWILQKVQQNVIVLFLDRSTGRFVPKRIRIQAITVEHHVFIEDSCKSCHNPWAVEWCALKVENLNEWIHHSSFSTEPWMNSTKQFIVKWKPNCDAGAKNRFYHFCNRWIQPHPGDKLLSGQV